MAKFAKYKLTTTAAVSGGATIFYFKAPDDAYEGITADDSGIDKVTNADEMRFSPACDVGELLVNGIASRKKLRIDAGTKTKYKTIIVARSKSLTFDTATIGTTVGGGTVKSCYTPLDRKFK